MRIIRDKISSTSPIMAIGVGGGGGNIVNHLYTNGVSSISYLLCNTDKQALNNSPIPDSNKILLGKEGIGAGNRAGKGAELAKSSIDDIKSVLEGANVKMVFIVAAMGGGTGTGASPVIASIAKSLGILTIGVVTIPFKSEGRPRIIQATTGVDEMSHNVDSIIIINNAHIVEIYGDLPLSQAHFKSNETVANAVRSISEIMTKHYKVNVDFADIWNVMRDSGVTLIGTGIASGKDRALEATKQALTSPLLHMQDITGAVNVLVAITSSSDPEYEIRMSDTNDIPEYIQKQTRTSNQTDVIWGAGYDDSLKDNIQVIIIATGFKISAIPSMKEYYRIDDNELTTQKPTQPVSQQGRRIQLTITNEEEHKTPFRKKGSSLLNADW